MLGATSDRLSRTPPALSTSIPAATTSWRSGGTDLKCATAPVGSSFAHDPSSMAERVGDMVRLTLDAHGTDDGPVADLSVDHVRRLVAGAHQDMQDRLQPCRNPG